MRNRFVQGLVDTFDSLKKDFLRAYGPSPQKACQKAFSIACDIYESYTRWVHLGLGVPTSEQVMAARGSKDLREAERLYRKAQALCRELGLDTNESVVLYQLGLLQRLWGQPEEAIPLYEEALNLVQPYVPSNPNLLKNFSLCHFYLGQALFAAGMSGAACQHLETALALDHKMGDLRRRSTAQELLSSAKQKKAEALAQSPVSGLTAHETLRSVADRDRLGHVPAEDGRQQCRGTDQSYRDGLVPPHTPCSRRPGGRSTDQLARRIRIFISSTFRDMIAERNEMMSHTWPALRRLCQERHVELVEVDLRWGIAEEQSTRKETLKLCLDEIRTCRPFFIGLLGERYGWVPGDDAFTADLKEEQSWLKDHYGKSVTELEILHGVLNNPDMAGRAFFYFRDPAYASTRGADFQSTDQSSADKQKRLMNQIRAACKASPIPIRENYPNPVTLAALVLADLSDAIEVQFPKANIPDSLMREAQDHEAFAEIRRRTYIGRDEYFTALDHHAAGEGSPLVLLGQSGGGKSALLANWLERWRYNHPGDFIVQHYIGSTTDSADHWQLMYRVMNEIKRWSRDPDALPTKHEDILKDFPRWLAKARAVAECHGVRFILVLDALNQLDDQDHARLLGWLPAHSLSGPLRLLVSSLPAQPGTDDPLAAVQQRGWQELHIQPLTVEERRNMIVGYLARFGKTLDVYRLNRLASAAPAANPLYLKILLDDLRVTGTYDHLDEQLSEYLSAADIPSLLQQVLQRYQRDYERDRPGLVSEVLSLIFAARRGMTESEILAILKQNDQPQLPLAILSPLRCALEEALVDRGGILNFAHEYLRAAVGTAFVLNDTKCRMLRLTLAGFFEAEPISARSCDELPWLLKETESRDRLRACILDINRFLIIQQRDEMELLGYWVWLGEERAMGRHYGQSFAEWEKNNNHNADVLATAASTLGLFLSDIAAIHVDAEALLRRAVQLYETNAASNHVRLTETLNNLAQLLIVVGRHSDAEPLLRKALTIDEHSLGKQHPDVGRDLNGLTLLFMHTKRPATAELFARRALDIACHNSGDNHPDVGRVLNNLGVLVMEANRLDEAEPLLRQSLLVDERYYGGNHPCVAVRLTNLALILSRTGRNEEAEHVFFRALSILEKSCGTNHPLVAGCLRNIWTFLRDGGRLSEARPIMHRALESCMSVWGESHQETQYTAQRYQSLLKEMGCATEEIERIIKSTGLMDVWTVRVEFS